MASVVNSPLIEAMFLVLITAPSLVAKMSLTAKLGNAWFATSRIFPESSMFSSSMAVNLTLSIGAFYLSYLSGIVCHQNVQGFDWLLAVCWVPSIFAYFGGVVCHPNLQGFHWLLFFTRSYCTGCAFLVAKVMNLLSFLFQLT